MDFAHPAKPQPARPRSAAAEFRRSKAGSTFRLPPLAPAAQAPTDGAVRPRRHSVPLVARPPESTLREQPKAPNTSRPALASRTDLVNRSSKRRQAKPRGRRMSFPESLLAKVQAVAATHDERISPVKRKLKALLSDRHVISADVKDFSGINKLNAWTRSEEKRSMIEARAREHEIRLRNARAEKALQTQTFMDDKRRSVESRLVAQQARRKQLELLSLKGVWLMQVTNASRLASWGQQLVAARKSRLLTLRQTAAVVCLQKRWRLCALEWLVKRRAKARRILVRVLVNWVRRLRLKWNRRRASVILRFLGKVKSMKTSVYAVRRYRHLVILVQRRFRSFSLMWTSRLKLCERLFIRVQDVMVEQAARARKGQRMSYRRRDAMRRYARKINDELAEHKVRPVTEKADTLSMRQTLLAHMKQKKRKYLEDIYAWFMLRCNAAKTAKESAPLACAASLCAGTVGSDVQLKRYVTDCVGESRQIFERPRFNPVMTTAEMAALVHEAVDKTRVRISRESIFLTNPSPRESPRGSSGTPRARTPRMTPRQ